MTTIAATLIAKPAKPAARRTWKQIVRAAFEMLGKHYSHGPYML